MEALQVDPEAAVATAGGAIALLERGRLALDAVSILALLDADALLDGGFEGAARRLLLAEKMPPPCAAQFGRRATRPPRNSAAQFGRRATRRARDSACAARREVFVCLSDGRSRPAALASARRPRQRACAPAH